MRIASKEDITTFIAGACRDRRLTLYATCRVAGVSQSTFTNGKDYRMSPVWRILRALDVDVEFRIPKKSQDPDLPLSDILVPHWWATHKALRVLRAYRGATRLSVVRAIGTSSHAFDEPGSRCRDYVMGVALIPHLHALDAELHFVPLTQKAVRRKLQISGGRVNQNVFAVEGSGEDPNVAVA